MHTSKKAKELMNQTMNSDTPPTEQRAKSNLLPEEKDGRILLFAKINSYIDDFYLVFYYLPFHVSVPVTSHMRLQQNQSLSGMNLVSNFCMP